MGQWMNPCTLPGVHVQRRRLQLEPRAVPWLHRKLQGGQTARPEHFRTRFEMEKHMYTKRLKCDKWWTGWLHELTRNVDELFLSSCSVGVISFRQGVRGGSAPHREREDEARVLLHQLAYEVSTASPTKERSCNMPPYRSTTYLYHSYRQGTLNRPLKARLLHRVLVKSLGLCVKTKVKLNPAYSCSIYRVETGEMFMHFVH